MKSHNGVRRSVLGKGVWISISYFYYMMVRLASHHPSFNASGVLRRVGLRYFYAYELKHHYI